MRFDFRFPLRDRPISGLRSSSSDQCGRSDRELLDEVRKRVGR
jgi:hypothetical protein